MVKRALLFAIAVLVSVSFAQAETFTVPSGTTIHCRLTQTIGTKLNYQGDAFTATVTEPYIVNGREIIPVGSTITGRIAELIRPGRIRGVGEMRLTAEQIDFPDGRSVPMSAVLLTTYGAEGVKVDSEEGLVRGPNSRVRDLKELGIGMGGGGFVGSLLGGFQGAVIGGAIVGGAALVDTLHRRGKELTLPTGTQLNYQLTRPLLVIPPAQSLAASRVTQYAPVVPRVETHPAETTQPSQPLEPSVVEEPIH